MISFVIPVKDEEVTLEPLCAEIADVAGRENFEFEILFVDDGSTDASWSRIAAIAARDGRVRGIRLRRNVGKAAALTAGFAHVRGEIVFTLDADLQDDPHEIPRFLQMLRDGYDLVSGWKKTRHDPWHKVWPSHVFNRLIGRLTGLHLHDHVCGFKACRSEIVRQVDLYGEMHRFFAVRAFALGYKVGEIVVHHRAREFGRSKYGVSRFVKGFLDLLTMAFLMRYGRRPMHFFGTVAGGMGIVGAILVVVSGIRSLSPNIPFMSFGLFAGLMLMLFGCQWLAVGFLAEHRLAAAPPGDAQYNVVERVGFGAVPVRSEAAPNG